MAAASNISTFQVRHPLIQGVTGMKGVGKTYLNKKLIEDYIQDNPATGKKGRKVIVYNVNMEADYNYRSIEIDPYDFQRLRKSKKWVKDQEKLYEIVRKTRIKIFSKLQAISIRVVVPRWRDGSVMSGKETKDLLLDIITGFRNGLILLEDIDKYATRASDQELISILTTNRHTSNDVWIIHQSLAKITTTEWENLTNLRMHYQNDDMSKYIDNRRCPNAEMVKIANLIITDQFDQATQLFRENKISQHDYDKYKSLALYLDFPGNKISGVSLKHFIKGCNTYLKQNYSIVKRLSDERDISGNKKYTPQEAFLAKMNQLLRYFG